MAVRRPASEPIQDLDAIDLLAQDHRDDLRVIRNFDFSIVIRSDLQKLTVLAMKYGYKGKIEKNNVEYVAGTLANMIKRSLDDYVKGAILQRVNEESLDRVPITAKKEKLRSPEDDWNG